MGEMAKQPLWQDVSSHQGELDYDLIAAYVGNLKIWGQFSRAGYGKYGGVKDMTFARNWEQSARFDYRASYWAYWDYFPLMHQLDLWYQQNPEIDFIPRMWDMEIELASPEFLSEQSWLASEEVFKRDGKRFIIYTRAGILERTLLKYWTYDQLNMHKYLLAQYDHSTPDNPEESEGIRIPAYPDGSWAIEPENILWKQTSSDFEIYPGSGRVDRDRWIWTDVETMHDDLQEIWGEDPEPPAPPPVTCDHGHPKWMYDWGLAVR